MPLPALPNMAVQDCSPVRTISSKKAPAPEPGNGIGGRLCDLRVIPQGLLVKILRVGSKGLPLGFFCGPVRFQLVVPDAAADGPANLTLGKFFPLVAALHPHVFMLNFVDFAVGE